MFMIKLFIGHLLTVLPKIFEPLVEVKFRILKNKFGLIKYFYLFIVSVLIHGHEMVTLFLHIPNVSVYFFVLYIFHMPISVWP